MMTQERRVRSTTRVGLFLAAAWLLSGVAAAQEATLLGTITDTTGGVLPGVTITATNTATGNNFVAVTDAVGSFRLPVRIGTYRVTAELQGFAPITRTVEVLVGQQATVNLQLSPSQREETITVSGQAPLIEATSSAVSSNIDARQMQELPINGRMWTDLTMLAAGSRQNISTDNPGFVSVGGDMQINIDGMRVTQNIIQIFGQPHYSRDAIAEFEFVANRFDATQGGSTGLLVNAVMKSGTNEFRGTASGYFRDDALNAEDFIQQRKIPYQNQQLVGTFGGPIRRDRIHFFFNHEFEREPQTFTHSSPYPSFNFDLSGTRTETKTGGRLDFQMSPRMRAMVRAHYHLTKEPYMARVTGGALLHPSATQSGRTPSTEVLGRLTQVLSDRVVNEVMVGYAGYRWDWVPVLRWPESPALASGEKFIYTSPQVVFANGYRIGSGINAPQDEQQDRIQVREDLTLSFAKWGRHDVKLGGEFINDTADATLCWFCNGQYDARGGPPPANLESLFPVWNDVSTWNLNALNPQIRFYLLNIGSFAMHRSFQTYSGWIQEDWQISPALTVNLGARYDLMAGHFGEKFALPPFRPIRPYDKNNFAPRAGAAYSVNDRTVVRGGFGKYFGDPGFASQIFDGMFPNQVFMLIFNDGRPDFATNPFNGPRPTYEQALARTCANAPTLRTCFKQSINNLPSADTQMPYSYQGSIGVQRQLGASIGVQADYSFIRSRAQNTTQNLNLSFDPATGANFPLNDVSRLPFPDWGVLTLVRTRNQENYQALQLSVTKRFSDRWQAQATYLLADQESLQVPPAYTPECPYVFTPAPSGGLRCDQPITLAPDFREEWYDAGIQRHRFVVNGIVEAGFGFQLSGLYFYGDQGWATPNTGTDVRATGVGAGRYRANGTFIERNSFDIPSLHRVDLRLQRRFTLGGQRSVDLIGEVFNLFNRANYGPNYVLAENNPRFGQPQFNNNVAYTPRSGQLGFRVSF